jgi:hypothetical protein
MIYQIYGAYTYREYVALWHKVGGGRLPWGEEGEDDKHGRISFAIAGEVPELLRDSDQVDVLREVDGGMVIIRELEEILIPYRSISWVGFTADLPRPETQRR